MTASAHEGTATIIQFPLGGRAGLAGGRTGTHVEPAASIALPRTSFGSASYHEAAILEEQRAHHG